MLSGRREQALERRSVVGTAQGDGGMSSLGEPDDEVGITTTAEAQDLDALAAEGVMRMGNGDESRRREG